MPSRGIIEIIDEGIDFGKKEQSYETVRCKSKTYTPSKRACRGCPFYWFENEPAEGPSRESGNWIIENAKTARGSGFGVSHCKLEDYAELRTEITKILNNF